MIGKNKEIIDRLNEFHAEYLKEMGIKNPTQSFKCFSPTHEDHNPSAKLFEDTNQVYCFGCKTAFNITDSCSIFENKPIIGAADWIDNNVSYLANKYNVNIDKIEKLDSKIAAMYKAVEVAMNLILSYKPNNKVAEYIKEKGWDLSVLKDLRIGCVTSHNKFIKDLKAHEFITDEIIKLCNFSRVDLFKPNNLLFTYINQYNTPVAFTAKNLLYQTNNMPKYTTSSRNSIFKKVKELYGLGSATKAIKQSKTVYVVEGQGDAITMHHKNIKNVVAIAGGSLTSQQIDKLVQQKISNIYILFDSDEGGKTALEDSIKTLSGVRGIKINILYLPANQDPDSFFGPMNEIEAHQALKKLHEKQLSLFEAQLQTYSDEEDEYLIAEKVCKTIASETNPLEVDKLLKSLSVFTSIEYNVLKETVDNLKDFSKQQIKEAKEKAISRSVKSLYKRPEEVLNIISELGSTIENIDKENGKSLIDPIACSDLLLNQKEEEEQKGDSFEGFYLPNFPILQNYLYGDWTRECLFLLGGNSNAGKSSFIAELALEIALNNDGIVTDDFGGLTKKTVVVFHTIDDSERLIANKMLAVLASKHYTDITMNMIKSPYFYINKKDYPEILLKSRSKAYQELNDLMKSGRLFLHGIRHGKTMGAIEHACKQLRKLYPPDEYRLIYILDNISDIQSSQTDYDKAERAAAISVYAKDIAVNYQCLFIATVEYKKLGMGRPTDSDFINTNKYRYKANIITHLWNDLHENPNSDLFWKSHDKSLAEISCKGDDGRKWAVTELLISKNKTTEHRSTSIYFDQIPPQSRQREISIDTLNQRRIDAAAGEYGSHNKINVDKDNNNREYEIVAGGRRRYLDAKRTN